MKIRILRVFFVGIYACFMGVLAYGQTQVAPFVNSHVQFSNASGAAPCNGCLLDTFAAGTTTPLATYSESTGTTPNSNPVVLGSDGSAVVYLTNASYKFRLRTAAGVTIWTQDNVTWNNLATTLSSLTLTGNATINSSTAATNVANQSGPTLCMDGNFWNGAASAVDSWCWNDVLGTGTNPTSTLTLVHSGSSGTSTLSVPALSASSVSVSGAINNVQQVATTSGDVGAAINAKDALIGSGVPGVIEVQPFTTATASTSIVLTKSHSLRIRGTGTLVVTGSGATPAIQIPDSTTDTTAISNIECPEHAILQLAANSNSAVIQDQNFLTLSGSGNTFGSFRVSIKGCQIDGNKANQTALVTTSTGTPSTVARTVGGVVTIVLTGTPSPALAVGQTCNVSGLTNDGSKFNGRFIAQSGTATNTLVYFQDPAAHGTIASTAATTAAPYTAMTVICYSGSNGIRLFGRSYWLEDVTVANNILDDIWVEGYTPTSFTDDKTQMEGTIARVRTMNSGGDGIVFWGPQNSKMWDTVHFNHGQWGREILQPMFDTDSVSYLNSVGSEHIFNVAVIEKGSQESGAAGFGILVEPGGGANIFEGVYTFCNGCIGLEFRSPGHKYSGIIGASSPANTIGVKFNSGSASIDAYMANNTTYFDCTSISGETMVKVWNNDAIGAVGAANCASGGDALGLVRTAVVQSPTAGNRINHNAYTSLYNAGNGFTMTFPAANITFAGTNAAQNFTAMQTFATNKAIVTTDFTTASATLVTITGLTINLPATALNYRFHCSLDYSQATAAVANAFGIQAATNAPTNIRASGIVYTAAATSTTGTLSTLSTTTATNIVTFTPSATATIFTAMIDGVIENPASANALNFMVLTGNVADSITVKRGSYCEVF